MNPRKWMIACGMALAGTALARGQTVGQAGAPNLTTEPTPRVEVFAFTPLGDVGSSEWIGKGIQESLQGDVSKTGAALVMAPAGAGDPVAVAKQNGARLAVVGTFQAAGGQIRANGHLIETASGQTVGGFSATGPQADLFKIEDALGEQMRGLLPGAMPTPQAAVADNLAPAPAANYPQATISYVSVPSNDTYSYPATNNYYVADTVPYYGYPIYGSGYSYPFGVGIGIYGGYGYGGYLPFGYYGTNYGYGRGYYSANHNYSYGRSYYGGNNRVNVSGHAFTGNGSQMRSNPGFNNPVYRGGAAGAGRGPIGGGGGLHTGGGGGGGLHIGGGGNGGGGGRR